MFTAYLKNGEIENKSFANINDINDIERLETNDVALVTIDFISGNIMLNNTLQSRISQYFAPNAKPIQYRKVVNFVGVYDYQYVINNGIDCEEKELLKQFLNNIDIGEQQIVRVQKYVEDFYGCIPYKDYEEQTIGYEYTLENSKTKIEITSNQEIQAVSAKITVTDLMTQQKQVRYIRLF